MLVRDELADDGGAVPVPMPAGWLEWALGKRPDDMEPRHVEWLWTKFARNKSGKERTWGDVQTRFHDWLMREKVGHRDPKPAKSIRKTRPRPAPAAEEPELPLPERMRELAKLQDALRAPQATERAA